MAVVKRLLLVTSIVVPTRFEPTPLMLRIVPVKSNEPVRSRRSVKVVATLPAA